MRLAKIISLITLLIAVATARSRGKNNDDSTSGLKPSDWLSAANLRQAATGENITLQQLENMPLDDGVKLMKEMYHLSQIGHKLHPTYVPSANNVPVIFVKPNGKNVETNLKEMAQQAKQQPNFGKEEVTIFITGLPETSPSVAKANRKLVEAYMQRYHGQQQPMRGSNMDYASSGEQRQTATSSEEDYSEAWKEQKQNRGDLVIIKLGATLNDMKRYALLDIEQTGELLGKALVQLTNENDVPHEIIHIVGQGMGAQVAGAAARQYKRTTGHQIRRITALDPAKFFASDKHILTGLARGDADFVDAIHTSSCGLGTRERVGDVDFYVNGISSRVPGADNIVEATARATRYFAESVRPGNERNFAAVPANSKREYENNEGYGRRAYMGIAAEYDLKGDYVLTVNAKSPFGKSAPAQKQTPYHSLHQSWRSGSRNE